MDASTRVERGVELVAVQAVTATDTIPGVYTLGYKLIRFRVVDPDHNCWMVANTKEMAEKLREWTEWESQPQASFSDLVELGQPNPKTEHSDLKAIYKAVMAAYTSCPPRPMQELHDDLPESESA